MINTSNTHWVFISGMQSEKDDKDRFLNDIFFGVASLLVKNVSTSNIDILIDPIVKPINPVVDNILSRFLINHISDYKTIINSKPHLENLVIIFTGHGSIHGIDSSIPIKPKDLLDLLHNTQKNDITVIFGQCFAGIYNYTNVINPQCNAQNICLFGASHLNSSLSSTTTINIGGILIVWSGNIFLYHFFNWIISPCDIDGDGIKSLMDAFKYSAGVSSDNLIEVRKDSFLHLYNLSEELSKLKKKKRRKIFKSSKASLDLEIKSIEIQIKEYTKVTHVNQDPWILNANGARKIEFAL